MNKPIVFMFSGQGSQFYQMGQELYENHPTFRKWIRVLDQMASDITSHSIVRHLYHGQRQKGEVFNQIRLTHPAIFMVEYAMAQVLLEMGVFPALILGTSMGEFVAAALAGIMDVEEAFLRVIRQAELFDKDLPPGGMIAVLDHADIYAKDPILKKNSVIASLNFNDHFVLSGLKESLKKIEQFLRQKEVNYLPLPILFAFHSSHIDGIREKFMALYAHYTYHPPKTPLLSCAYPKEMSHIDAHYFWDIIRNPVHFSQAIANLEAQGSHIYLDLGPSGTLSTFTKYNLPQNADSETYPIITPFGREMRQIAKLKDRLPRRRP